MPSRLRILFVTPQVPYPPDKGTKMRNLGVIEGVSRFHDVGLVTLSDRSHDPLPPDLVKLCAYTQVVASPAPRGRLRRSVDLVRDRRPDLALRLATPLLRDAVSRACATGRWDVVQLEGLETALAVGDSIGDACAIYDAHNAEWLLQARAAERDVERRRWIGAVYSLIQASRLRAAEGRIVTRSRGVVAVSHDDAVALRAVGTPRDLCVIPNGIDADRVVSRATDGQPGSYLFTGTMDYRPNIDGVVWFVEHVWPAVRRSRPEAVFHVVGRNPAASVRNLATVPGVVVHGEVASVAPFFAQARVVVVPLLVGGGARLKVLEAFARGIPVVSTSLGVEGIDAVDGATYLRAEDPDSFVAALACIEEKPDLRQQLGAAGRALVESRYDWSVLVPRLIRFYERCIGVVRT